MRFVDSLAPIARANESAARVAMIVDAISVEAHRATTMAAAGALLTRTEPLRLRACRLCGGSRADPRRGHGRGAR